MADIIIYDPSDNLAPNRVVAYVSNYSGNQFDGNPNTVIDPTFNANTSGLPSRFWKWNDTNNEVEALTTLEQEDVQIVLSYNYKHTEKLVSETTLLTDYNYLMMDLYVQNTSTYKISYGVQLAYANVAWQYIKYLVDVDGTTFVTDPAGDGWVQPTLYDLAANGLRGMSFSGSRPLVLAPGYHTINLRVGTTSTGAVAAQYGKLEIELK